ncbi:MAG: hypothetical protein NC827_05360 [Candidatus Omnitrophica bacterium]|nr:hypothetical protein [Candidatus Omnitrophota bacterium]MCM8802718.1 hypothetical protein [Candidatus Omnitrophota bacterium]
MKIKIFFHIFFIFFLSQLLSFEIISPENDSTHSDKIEFSVKLDKKEKFEIVEYFLNGKKFSGPLSFPFNFTFEGSLLWDGEFEVYAIGKDKNGNIKGKTKSVKFRIEKDGYDCDIKIVEPNLDTPLSGKINLKIEVEMPLSDEIIEEKQKRKEELKPIEAIMLFIDGKLEKIQFGSPWIDLKTKKGKPVILEYELDTTKFINGSHEIFVSVWAHLPGIPPVGMLQKYFIVDNQKKIRDIRPFWKVIYIKEGEVINIQPYILYTDGTREIYKGKVDYEIKNKEIVEIDENMNLKGLKQGITEVIIKTENYKNIIPVIVKDFEGFPHFSKDGRILYNYNNGNSIFLRSLFFLGPGEIEKNEKLLKQVKFAEINALTTGFYQNPADSGTTEYEKWKNGWLNWVKRFEKIAKENNFSFILTGDDICRTPKELNNSVKNPWAKDAIKDAFQWARDSKVVSCIEMMDEASLWGGNPLPSEKETARWEKVNPPSPKDAFNKLMEIINSVPGRPPISWPVLGLSPPIVAKNWMGNPFMSDYTSNYWDILDWRRAYPYYGASFPQYRKYLDWVTYERMPYMQLNKPFLLLVSICGPYYQKLSDNGEFQPGKDKLNLENVGTAESVSLQIMYAIANNYSGVRCYAFDSSLWKRERKQAKIGTGGLQTGAEPFETGTDRWYALSTCFNLIKRLESVILQEMSSSVDVGPEIVTGAKKGEKGNLLILTNFSEVEQKINVPLFPYIGKNKKITMFRLLGAELFTEKIDYIEFQKITIKPSETIIYLFSEENFPTIKFITPLYKEKINKEKKVIIDAQNEVEEIKVFLDGELIKILNQKPFEFILNVETLKKGISHNLFAVAKNKDNLEGFASTLFSFE